MKRNFYIAVILAVIGCKTSRYEGASTITLNFEDCGPGLGYSKIELSVPKKYTLSKTVDDHGFCEYRFTSPKGVILYISSNVYYGSALNYENRFGADVITYSGNRSLDDSITNGGMQDNGQYWLEWVKGNYVLGYVNQPDSINPQDIFLDVILLD